MTERLAELNALPWAEAVERLRKCCASDCWAGALADRRPYADPAELLRAGDEVWTELGPKDWLEAIAHHPRLGGSDLEKPRFDATRALSRREQGVLLSADPTTRAALSRAQEAYERRFGYIFLTAAAGKSAAEILAEIERRMGNEPATELATAAREIGRIAQLRLAAEFGERHTAGRGEAGP